MTVDKKKKEAVARRIRISVGVGSLVTAFLCIWTYKAMGQACWWPEYDKEDISEYLKKAELNEEEYDLIYHQTGLAQMAVDELRRGGRQQEILAVQERYFAKPRVVCEQSFFLFREMLAPEMRREATGRMTFMPVLEDGDILITFSSHFLGWQNGHAALVIDAEAGLTLEALTLGEKSAVLSVEGWRRRPSFIVLRLKGVSADIREDIAKYAKENLVELPYRLSAGAWERLSAQKAEMLTGTHCSHLVWYVYKLFGYDLDSDGGWLVTPKDISASPLLEVVQIYGMKP
jgi:uncharacterized protein YycO